MVGFTFEFYLDPELTDDYLAKYTTFDDFCSVIGSRLNDQKKACLWRLLSLHRLIQIIQKMEEEFRNTRSINYSLTTMGWGQLELIYLEKQIQDYCMLMQN